MASSEYRGAVWQGPGVLDSFCPRSELTETLTGKVIDFMAAARNVSPKDVHTKPYRAGDTTCQWSDSWPTLMPEETSNTAFISLLNEICEAVMQNQDRLPYFEDVTFVDHHNQSTLDGIDSAAPLKPDGGLFRRKDVEEAKSNPRGTVNRFRWRQFFSAVGVKKDIKELLAQAFTYARAMFVASDRRWFALVITFNFKTTEVRFTFWTRWAMYATTPFMLEEKDGYDRFVGAVVRMLMWKDEEAAGFFSHRNDAGLWLDTIGLLKLTSVLSYRACGHGRASRVFLARDLLPFTNSNRDEEPTGRQSLPPLCRSMRLQKQGVNKHPSQPTSAPTSLDSGPSAPRFGREENPFTAIIIDEVALLAESYTELQAIHNYQWKDTPDEAHTLLHFQDRRKKWETLVQKQISQGQTTSQFYVVKESWVGSTYDEGKMFDDTHRNTINGAFGVAKVETTSRFAPVHQVPDVEPWTIFGEHTSSEQEQRSYVTSVTKTVGKSLFEAPGPEQLVTAVLHAVVGHYNITSTGWLHGDVSIGNIIYVPKGETRDTSKWIPLETKSVGFMIDGDLAIRFMDPERVKASSRSGTPPFMSVRMLALLAGSEFGRSEDTIIQSFTDDLEGYAWVLIWAAISADSDNMEAQMWMQMLEEDGYKQLTANKSSIVLLLMKHKPRSIPPSVYPIINLLNSLFDTLDHYGDLLDTQLIDLHGARGDGFLETRAKVTEKINKLMEEVYGSVIDAFRQELNNGKLPKTWGDIQVPLPVDDD